MSTPSFDTLQLEHRDAVTRITLNRPDKLNSFDTRMCKELIAALTHVQTDGESRCLILTGAGRGFSAGQDLADLDLDDLKDVVDKHFNPIVRMIATLRMPVIAEVNGVAAGAGCNLALGCDVVLAAHSASFIQSFVHVGLVPDGGGTWLLPRLVGQARAMALVMSGEPVDAETAERWGMIYKCVPDDALQEQTWTLAQHLASRPTTAIAYMKILMRESWKHGFDAQLDLERDYQQAASKTADFREGIDAFLSRREPTFKGQ